MKYSKIIKEQGENGYEYLDEDLKKYLIRKWYVIVYFISFFLGLLTDQWFLYLIFLMIHFGIFCTICNLLESSKYRIIPSFLSNLFSALFTLFIILNYYHFKIDCFNVFLDYIK